MNIYLWDNGEVSASGDIDLIKIDKFIHWFDQTGQEPARELVVRPVDDTI